LSQPLLKHTQDILTEAIPARSYTEGSTLNLARAALFGVPLSKVESIVELLRTYRGGKPNSLILGGPLGWSWQATLDTTHHGSLAGPANAHRHSDLANIGIDDHHARDHATRHAVGGGDQVSLDASQIGSGTFGVARGGTGLSTIAAGGILYASAADTLSRIAPTAANQVLRSTAANALQIAALVAADIPNLDASKITTGTFGVARGGTGLSSIAAGGILYASAADTLSRIAPTAANQVLRSTAANALQIAALVAADIPSLDASKITSGRFGMARMPDGTSGYFLKAAGAGSDPAYANHDVDTGVHGVGSNYVCQAPASGHLVRAFTKGWTAEKLLKGAGVGADPTEIDVPNTLPAISIPSPTATGSRTFSGGGETWTPPEGFYNFVGTNTFRIEIYVSGAWQAPGGSQYQGCAFCDGTGVRIYNTVPGVNNVYYQQWT
jgi:hypothetical protein